MNACAGVISWGALTTLMSITFAQNASDEAKQKPLPFPIRGWAVSPNGSPLWTVEIEPVSPDGAFAVVLVSQTDGSFESEPLPPGRYRLGVSLGLNRQPCQAYPKTYYPGTRSAAQAIEIVIGESDAPLPIFFNGPPIRPGVTVKGTVVYTDDKPAIGVDVFLSQIDENHSTAQVWTNDKGAFQFVTYGAVDFEIL